MLLEQLEAHRAACKRVRVRVRVGVRVRDRVGVRVRDRVGVGVGVRVRVRALGAWRCLACRVETTHRLAARPCRGSNTVSK